MKLKIEEKDETMSYRPIDIERQSQMLKDYYDRLEILVPNQCGGETKITVYKNYTVELFGVDVGVFE